MEQVPGSFQEAIVKGEVKLTKPEETRWRVLNNKLQRQQAKLSGTLKVVGGIKNEIDALTLNIKARIESQQQAREARYTRPNPTRCVRGLVTKTIADIIDQMPTEFTANQIIKRATRLLPKSTINSINNNTYIQLRKLQREKKVAVSIQPRNGEVGRTAFVYRKMK